MEKDKSILEKFTETMKGLADSASEALKSEEPANAPVAAYMPLGAEGLVSDPLLVPPVAAQPVRKKRRVAKKRSAKTAKKSAPRTSARKAAKKAAKTPAKEKASAKKSARASARKRSKKAAKRRR